MVAEEKRVALVIGNGAYAHASMLANPGNDARGIAAALTRIGFSGIAPAGQDYAANFKTPGVSALADLEYNALRRALAAFGRAADQADQAILYYAGHGIEVGGQNYLIPVDARLAHAKDVDFETASLMQVLGAVDGASGLRLVILDACRDNPFRTRLFPGREVSRGLRAIEPAGSVLVAYAAKHGTVALDGKGMNSPYASAILTHIEEPGLDIVDLFREVKDDVLAATGQQQEPYLYGSLGRRRVYLVPPEPEPQPQTTPPEAAPFDPVQVELQWWERVKDSGNPALLTEFLQRYPDGTFASLARDTLAALEWNRVKASRNAADFEAFIARWPGSRFEPVARAKLAAMQRRAERSGGGIPWKMAAGIGAAAVVLVAGYALWPDTPSRPSPPKQAQPSAEDRAQAEDDKAFAAAERRGTKEALEAYLNKYRRHAEEAKKQLAALDYADYRAAERANTEKAFEAYRRTWPDGLNFKRAGERIAALQAAAKAEAARKAAERLGKVAVTVRAARGRDEEKWLKPGEGKTESFRDCINRACTAKGPEMVVVPAGSFMMGSPENEKKRDSDEGPRHKVTIKQPFAVGKFEVTFAEWDACVENGGCEHKPKAHWGRGDQPVINVSWKDITNEYLPWLRKKTGKDYRLLSEAEWEYVARAGSRTPFWWGSSINTGQANYDGNYTYGGGRKGEYRKKTVPVKSFRPNPWGLYQVHGNVREWTEDCWNSNYDNAPTDGSAWTTGNCGRRVLRGGSWGSLPRNLRSAFRLWWIPDIRDNFVGFRLSRTLNL